MKITICPKEMVFKKLSIFSRALKRLDNGISNVVLGVSGGLDSTLVYYRYAMLLISMVLIEKYY